jgi:hypothetical protein
LGSGFRPTRVLPTREIERTSRWVGMGFLTTWGRTLHIDRRRPKAGSDDNESALFVAIVAFPVHRPLGDMNEVTSHCPHDLRATRATLQS